MTSSAQSDQTVLEYRQACDRHLASGDYAALLAVCEEAIATQPDQPDLYQDLGLAYVLNGQETEAQATWFMAYQELDEAAAEIWLDQLITRLDQEATRQTNQQSYAIAAALRRYIQEFAPTHLGNLAALALLAEPLNDAAALPALLVALVEAIPTVNQLQPSLAALTQALGFYLIVQPAPAPTAILAYLEALLTAATLADCRYLLDTFIRRGPTWVRNLTPTEQSRLTAILWPAIADQIDLLVGIANLYQNAYLYAESIPFLERALTLQPTLADQVAIHSIWLRGLIQAGGQWDQVQARDEQLQASLRSLLADPTVPLSEFHLNQLITATAYSHYIADQPATLHRLRHQVMQRCYQPWLDLTGLTLPPRSLRADPQGRKLRIGYLSSSIHQHSVGWISRWLFQHHNQDDFEIYLYAFNIHPDPVQAMIRQQATVFRDVSTQQSPAVAQQIYADQVDILVELDSLTSQRICGVMMLKPAPIQVTWLGFDASQIGTIDYFMADRYVLPEEAQSYYAPKIWRLPDTYVAVDGFEVDIPTLRRRDLGVPDDAVLYFTAQVAAKRHPAIVRAQLEIIRQVPNSYLLIKGLGDQQQLQRSFEEMAIAGGLDPERLRFLPRSPSEAVHRANLGMVDVVLDTYPYNGATTTLETLWLGVPLVTRVGEQFSARNSYTMLMNVGVTAGIAWNEAEYIEWGVKFGLERRLRQAVSWQLQQSRHAAPLWDTATFTQHLEAAYRQMVEQFWKESQHA